MDLAWIYVICWVIIIFILIHNIINMIKTRKSDGLSCECVVNMVKLILAMMIIIMGISTLCELLM